MLPHIHKLKPIALLLVSNIHFVPGENGSRGLKWNYKLHSVTTKGKISMELYQPPSTLGVGACLQLVLQLRLSLHYLLWKPLLAGNHTEWSQSLKENCLPTNFGRAYKVLSDLHYLNSITCMHLIIYKGTNLNYTRNGESGKFRWKCIYLCR